MTQVELTVNGDRMVDRAKKRPAVTHHAEKAGPERLIVVHEIEIPEPGGQQPPRPQAERERFGEAGRAHEGELCGVDRRMELRRPWTRNGSGSLYKSRLGTPTKPTPFSSCGYGCPENTVT